MAVGATALLILTAASASAGGSWLEPSWVRVEPGDALELSGDVSPGQLGWVDDGPYFVYLSGADYGITLEEGLGGNKTDVPLGELKIEPSGNWARVSVAITLPEDAPPGEYWISVCNDPCKEGFGDLIGSVLFVGMDPPDDALAEPAVSVSTPTTTTGAAIVNRTSESTDTTYLALAPHPARRTGLKVAWVAISATLAIAALAATELSRRNPRRADKPGRVQSSSPPSSGGGAGTPM